MILMKKFLRIFFYLYLAVRYVKITQLISYLLASEDIIEVEVNLFKVKIRKNSTDFKVALHSLTYEFDFITQYLPRDFSGLIIDAGAYIGTASLKLNRMFPYAKIVAVEASPENVAILSLNTRGIENIRIIHAALVSKLHTQKVVEIYDRASGKWGHSIIERDSTSELKSWTVPAVTLSAILKGDNQCGLIKLDIEGAEKDILQNDQDSLLSAQVVIAELHDWICEGCEDAFMLLAAKKRILKSHGEKWVAID